MPDATNPSPEAKKTIICRRCKEQGHIERHCKKSGAEANVITIARDQQIKQSGQVTSYVCKGYIDGCEAEMKLNSGADVIIVHRDLVHPSKIKTNDQLQLECVHGDKVSHPIASVSIQIGNESHRVEAAITDGLKKRVIVGKKFPNFARMLQAAEKGKLERPENMIVTRAPAKRQKEQEEEESGAERDCGVVPKKLEDGSKPIVLQEFGQLESMHSSCKEKVPQSRSQKREQRRGFSDCQDGNRNSCQVEYEDILHIGLQNLIDCRLKTGLWMF